MRILAGALLSLCVLLAACGGDEEPTVTPTQSSAQPTPVPSLVTPVAVMTPSPTPALSTFGVVDLPPLPLSRTLDRIPAGGVIQAPSPDESAWQVLFYTPASGRITALDTSAMAAMAWGWTPAGPALAYTTSGLVLYDPNNNTAQRLDLREEVRSLLVSKTTPRAALEQASTQIALLDLTTWHYQPIALNARPIAWSPDGQRLLVQVAGAGQAVLLLDQLVPRLYTLPVSLGTGYVGWLSNTRLLAVQTAGSQTPVGQVVDVAGASPVVRTLPGIIGTGNISFSPDASRVAIGVFAPTRVQVFETAGMTQIGDYPGMLLGSSVDVGNGLWSSDSKRVLMLAGFCTADERIVMVDLNGRRQIDIVKGAPYSMDLSPDDRVVAYTLGREIYTVPADGSTAPRQVFGKVWGPAPIDWSGDGRTLGFLHYIGGYGRCS